MKKTALLALMAFGLTPSGRAANLVWTPSDANWDLTTTNWVDSGSLAPVAFAQGDNVLFNDTGTGQPAVALGANSLSPNSVLVDSSSQYSFASTTGGKLTGGLSLVKRSSGTLILDADNAISGPTSIEGGVLQIGSGSSRGSVGSGWITNDAGLVINRSGTLDLTGNLSGVGTLTNVAGTLNITGTNTMSGLISINAGTVILSGAPAVGNSADVHINATAVAAGTRLSPAGGIDLPASKTIRMQGLSTGSHRTTLITLDGTTNSVSSPILIGEGAGLVQINSSSTNLGQLEVKGSISNHLDNTTPFSGRLYLRGTGNGILTGTVNLPEANCIRTDAGTFTVASSGNSWKATLVAVGRLRLGADNALPSVEFSMGQGGATNAILDLNGFNQQLPGVTSVTLSPVPIIANSSTTSDSILTISSPAGIYGGLIQDSIYGGTRKVGLKIVSGAQQLTTNCTYSGPTTILGGGLVLKDSGSISNTASIEINGPSALDVSLRTDGTLWLGTAQTLKGNGMFNITGDLASQGTIELKASKSGGVVTNDILAVTGQLTCGGKLKLVLGGETLNATDTLPILNAGSFASIAFATIEPVGPGPGLLWDTSSLAIDGTLRIVGPLTGTAVLSPSGIVFSGTGGLPDSGYSVVTSTNITDPLASWTTAQTGSFDASGNFSVTNPITSGEPKRFFRLRVP